jgi:hypothetical protein
MALRLFDEFERTDPSPARPGEDSFSFMNRVDQPFWQRIREELERWFADYPQADAADLRGRLRDAAAGQHFGAWWELYLHRLFQCLGFEVEVHPDLPCVQGRPDFRVSRGSASFLLEGATTFSGIVDEGRHAERESWITSAINEASNPNFFVGLEFGKVGMERPGVREIVRPIEDWLAGLDPDEISAAGLADAPELPLKVRDWELTLTAIPIKPEARGKPDLRLLGLGPSMAGYVNDVDMLARTLQRKRRKYGKPNEPLVLAVLPMSGFMDNEDIEQALLGRVAYQFDPESFQAGDWVRQRNGFWMKGDQPRATRISAVITGTNVMPWTVARIWPRLWRNPWAAHPLHVDLPFPRGIASENGVVEYQEVAASPNELFGLASDWPGPEDPFTKS